MGTAAWVVVADMALSCGFVSDSALRTLRKPRINVRPDALARACTGDQAGVAAGTGRVGDVLARAEVEDRPRPFAVGRTPLDGAEMY
jgi:hypothetical protein